MDTLESRLQYLVDAWEQKHQQKFNNTRFSEHCGVSKQAVGDWRKGRIRNLKSDALFKAAEYFGVTPGWLRTGKGLIESGDSPSVVIEGEVNQEIVDWVFKVIFEALDGDNASPNDYAELLSNLYQLALSDPNVMTLNTQTLLKISK